MFNRKYIFNGCFCSLSCSFLGWKKIRNLCVLFRGFGRLDRNWISSSAVGDYLGAIIGSMAVVGVDPASGENSGFGLDEVGCWLWMVSRGSDDKVK